MTKRKNTIQGKAKGILSSLAENNEAKEEKQENIKEEKSNRVKEDKKKRSFMLGEKQVERLYILKAKNSDKTLSELVCEAIDKYYEEKI